MVRRLVLTAATAFFFTAVPADAQSTPPDYLLLARSCVSERGWRVETDDCAAIAEVVRHRMDVRGETFAQSIRALAPRLHGGTLSRRLWLLDLDEDAHRPRELGAARWEGMRRDAWIATLEESRRILAGEVPSPCVERPHTWGSTQDLARRRAAGYRWIAAECPGATFANHFGRLLRRSTRDARDGVTIDGGLVVGPASVDPE